jgi:glycosyltransferase involved in cell wall biosynthesis
MYLHHDVLDIYDKISAFISPSLFLKTKLEEMGFKKKIFHIFNFMDAFPGHSDHANKGKYILYFGRVSSEKGIMTLLKAIKGTGISLKIAGTGPFEEEANAFIKKETVNEAELIGYQTGMGLQNLIQTAMFTVLPSEWYENNPLSVLESFSYGKPVIGSRIGGIPELVIDNRTGFTFETGNHDDLRQKIVYLHNHLKLSEEMGEKGRQFVEVACNPTSYYNKLMEIYAMAISRK